MPSALESLVKVLKLEKKNGYTNKAVIGGLGEYAASWVDQAHKQARKPEHHVLVDELVDRLAQYEAIEEVTDRLTAIEYMLERIMGRLPVPDDYAEKLAYYQQQFAEAAPVETEAATAPNDRPQPPRKAKSGDPVGDKRGRSAQLDSDSNIDPDMDGPLRNGASSLDIPPEPTLARPPRQPRQPIDAEEASDIIRGLNAEVTTLKGVGPRMAKALTTLGITSINDMLFYLPRRYDDYTRLLYVSRLRDGMVTTVIGTVKDPRVAVGRSGRKDYVIELDDGSGVLPITFFGQHFLSKTLRRGKQIVVSGKVTLYRGRIHMANPEWEEIDREMLHTTGIVPVYRLTEGLSGRRFRNLMRDTVRYWANRLPDYMPEAVLDRTELADLGWAIENLHFPAGQDHLHHARRRYMFDQLLLLQLAILANRREHQSQPGRALVVDGAFLDDFIAAAFPYALTGAQRHAIDDILEDMSRPVPMNRLLQGDVGSGKTAVAVTAMAMAVANGAQAALMAPTGILAEQHYRGISRTLEAMPGDNHPVVALLTSALSTSERESIYRGLADGSIDIVIGTHALIQEGVTFNDLALAVIDEQHRFGVEQRGTLRGKGTNPHILVMTATPIPRTMALTLYADLDLSVMDEMPPGRTPVETRIVLPGARKTIHNFIEGQVQQGRQVFVVHPLVEASDKVDARAAVDAFELLSQEFHRYRVCLLHGRMKPAEKEAIMGAFANHEYDIMVTTSVAEVGVDVPNATVIVIEGANRFGLAQLHQFRGRVGRGQYASYCLLVPDDATPETAHRLEEITLDHIEDRSYPESERRLRAMELLTDGFELADIDWRLRGAGDLVGTRQSGRNQLQIAEMMTPDLVQLAQQEARTLYAEDPYLAQEAHRLLKERVDMLYHPETDVS